MHPNMVFYVNLSEVDGPPLCVVISEDDVEDCTIINIGLDAYSFYRLRALPNPSQSQPLPHSEGQVLFSLLRL